MKPKNHLLGTSNGGVEVRGVMDRLTSLIDNVAVKVSVTLYGTLKDIHDPQCIPNLRIALWFFDLSNQNKTKEWRLVNRYMSDCTIDANNKITDKDGIEVVVTNIDDVLEAVNSAVDAIKLNKQTNA